MAFASMGNRKVVPYFNIKEAYVASAIQDDLDAHPAWQLQQMTMAYDTDRRGLSVIVVYLVS